MAHRFISALTENKNADAALGELARHIQAGLDGLSCDALLFFVSEGYENSDFPRWTKTLLAKTGARHLLGCNANGVIGTGREIEMQPAMSVMAMHLENVRIEPFAWTPHELAGFKTGDDLVKNLDLYPNDQPGFLCFGDPMSCDVNRLLQIFNQGFPAATLAGGLASGVVVQAETKLWLDGEVSGAGALGLALAGNLEMLSLVSQGCRPVGTPLAVTKAEQNILYEIAGKPALKVLQETYESLSPEDKELARHSLFVGLAMDEFSEHFSRGDFLIRNIMGADQQNGALAVGEMLAPGQTIQFQLRDRKASEEDLQWTLGKLPPADAARTEGALLVNCCGRGRGLFTESDHDARMIQAKRDPLPLTGFFANGEFGPVKGRNYIHGYTSSLTIFR